MNGEFALGPDEILFLFDGDNTVGIVKAGHLKRVFIETEDEELVQFLGPEDLIAASCFEGGEKAREMVRSMLFLVREGGTPLLVLRKSHPATQRLKLVVSAGDRIVLSGCIVPGTHPEQDVLCGKGAMDGIVLEAGEGRVLARGGGSPHAEKGRFL
ncbi:conserved hypothetical protein [Methanocella paludicola SANAE]|uniref:Uncharacterized protein n=1 Tax=Methanocella paludicola (strain DSM 17711 / JCM 13418 / NBRC 101707 / SANAE) TaxID=304371 RepID=D1YVV6_METPS|nr:hypothetical protein [Methanocella paludicola]BAI60578.1 conserved hypothetical protein [Methanocella paludicola SANAE]